LKEGERKNSLKMKERRGNVYENKGTTFSSPLGSRNVVENKGTYPHKAGILLKIKALTGRRW
jgi:hypothetical protein